MRNRKCFAICLAILLIISVFIGVFSIGRSVEGSNAGTNSFDSEDYILGDPVVPASYYGELTINGRPSPAGVKIVTMIDGGFTGNFTTYEPRTYGDKEEGIFLVVDGTSDDVGKEIDFYVEDYHGNLIEAESTDPSEVEFQSGAMEEVDLTFEDVDLDPSLPSLTDIEARDITSNSAELSTSIIYNQYSSGEITFFYREEAEEWENTGYESVSETSYSTEVDELEKDTTYEFFPYIEVKDDGEAGDGTTGPIKQFTTLEKEQEHPTVGLEEAEEVTESSALLQAEIDYKEYDVVDIQFSYRKIEENGWKETGYETITTQKYEYKVTSLESNTEYEYYATILFDGESEESEKETFATEKAPPMIKEIRVSDITTDEATLEKSYELNDYDSAILRFGWRRLGEDWRFTEWTERVESGLHTETLENLESGEEYEYKGQIEYDSELLESDVMSFEISTEENQPPIAEFSWSPEEPEEGAEVVFDASESYDPDGEIEEYKWSFGDGEEGSGEITSHTYSEGGEYTVVLEVVDDEGVSTQRSKMISVIEVEPPKFQLSEITLDKEDVTVGDEVTVSITITNTGGLEGEYEAVLFLNEEELDSKTVKLEPTSEETVSFSFTMEEEGEQTISIGERSKTIQVEEEVGEEDAIGGPYRLLLLLLAIIGSIILKKME